MIRINIIHFEIDSPQHDIHIFHNNFRVMVLAISVNFTSASHCVVAASLPGAPSPGQFWAVMVWMVLPITLGIWVVYFQQKERLRKIRRRLRQLEARLGALSPKQAAVSSSPAFSAARPARPSSLTARILIAPGPASPSPFSQPVVGSGH